MGAVPILAGLALLAYLQFGSLGVAASYLRGDRLIVRPAQLTFGEGPRGAKRTPSFTVLNLTGRDVCITGSKQECGCIAVEDFPITVPSGGRHEITVSVSITGDEGEFDKGVFFFTDCPEKQVFRVRVRGTVLPEDAK